LKRRFGRQKERKEADVEHSVSFGFLRSGRDEAAKERPLRTAKAARVRRCFQAVGGGLIMAW